MVEQQLRTSLDIRIDSIVSHPHGRNRIIHCDTCPGVSLRHQISGTVRIVIQIFHPRIRHPVRLSGTRTPEHEFKEIDTSYNLVIDNIFRLPDRRRCIIGSKTFAECTRLSIYMCHRRGLFREVIDRIRKNLVPDSVNTRNLDFTQGTEEIPFGTYAVGHVMVFVQMSDIRHTVRFTPVGLKLEEMSCKKSRPYIPIIGLDTLFCHCKHRCKERSQPRGRVIPLHLFKHSNDFRRPRHVGIVGLVATEPQYSSPQFLTQIFLILGMRPVHKLLYRYRIQIVAQGIACILSSCRIIDGTRNSSTEITADKQYFPIVISGIEIQFPVLELHGTVRLSALAYSHCTDDSSRHFLPDPCFPSSYRNPFIYNQSLHT